MDHKVELGVKGIWKDKEKIFKEIVKEKKEIREGKREDSKRYRQKEHPG